MSIDEENSAIAYEGASQLYLLSWYDALDRLDTLLLEARHLQLNIISTLRTPSLLAALRHEEEHLWGKGWDLSLETEKPEDLVDRWMVPFPHPYFLDDYLKTDEADETDEKFIKEELHRVITKTLSDNVWGKEQNSSYYTLQAIQHLKRKIFKDKLILSEHALKHSYLYKHLSSQP